MLGRVSLLSSIYPQSFSKCLFNSFHSSQYFEKEQASSSRVANIRETIASRKEHVQDLIGGSSSARNSVGTYLLHFKTTKNNNNKYRICGVQIG